MEQQHNLHIGPRYKKKLPFAPNIVSWTEGRSSTTREFPGSSTAWRPVIFTYALRGFPLPLQTNYGIMSQIMPQPLHNTLFLNPCSPSIVRRYTV